MKTVFTSAEIAHVWANKSAPHGRSPGAMSFNGDAFSSYSTVIARHGTHKGKPYVIMNNTSYSVTTSQHQSAVNRSWTPETTVFRVESQPMRTDLRLSGNELFTHYIEQAAKQEALSLAPRIRQTTRDAHKASAGAFLEQAKAVSDFFGLRKKVDAKAVARLATSKAKEEKRQREAQEKRDVAYRLVMRDLYEAWMRGEKTEYFDARLFPVAFRVEGDDLVSTLGARVPLQSARVAYRFALHRRAQGWHRNGETCEVGMYHLDAINEHGIVAGCHRISWSEIERLAPVLSVAP